MGWESRGREGGREGGRGKGNDFLVFINALVCSNGGLGFSDFEMINDRKIKIQTKVSLLLSLDI